MNLGWLGVLILVGFGVWLLSKMEPQRPDGSPAAYAQPPAPYVPPPPQPVEKVKVAKQDWLREGFGNVATATIWIENGNDYPVRDVTVECDFHGASGTRIHRKREVLFEKFPAKKTTRVAKINLGFIDQQLKTAGCTAVGALRQ